MLQHALGSVLQHALSRALALAAEACRLYTSMPAPGEEERTAFKLAE